MRACSVRTTPAPLSCHREGWRCGFACAVPPCYSPRYVGACWDALWERRGMIRCMCMRPACQDSILVTLRNRNRTALFSSSVRCVLTVVRGGTETKRAPVSQTVHTSAQKRVFLRGRSGNRNKPSLSRVLGCRVTSLVSSLATGLCREWVIDY